MSASAADHELVEAGRAALAVEADAVAALARRLDGGFAEACRLIAGAEGRVLVSGIGKSGVVARKVAATLTSTGTPALFLHPVEALHGDLGAVGAGDVAVVLSKSGQASELAGLVEQLGRLCVPLVALVGGPGGELAAAARVTLDCSVEREACPLGLTPTASTTAMLALGDALAVVVMRLKGWSREDFAAVHPGGALGRRLTLRVADVMVSEAYPWLPEAATMRDAIAPLARMRGTVPVVDQAHRLVGVVTAGDLTRLMERDPDFLDRPVTEVMTRGPRTASPGELGSAAADRLRGHGIMALPVVGADGRVVGIVHLHDLMRAGVV